MVSPIISFSLAIKIMCAKGSVVPANVGVESFVTYSLFDNLLSALSIRYGTLENEGGPATVIDTVAGEESLIPSFAI